MKYKITDETLNHHSTKLYRIQALRDFGDIKAGDLGGWIEKESNLSQEGDCWIYDEAKVYDDARVQDNARIYDYVEISDYAMVGGKARISDEACIYGNAIICGDAEVCENADVFGEAQVYGNAKVMGHAQLYGRVQILGNALIKSTKDYCVFQGFGSRDGITNFHRDSDGDIFVRCGCFYGSLKEFKTEVIETHGDNNFAKEYLAMIKLVKIRLRK